MFLLHTSISTSCVWLSKLLKSPIVNGNVGTCLGNSMFDGDKISTPIIGLPAGDDSDAGPWCKKFDSAGHIDSNILPFLNFLSTPKNCTDAQPISSSWNFSTPLSFESDSSNVLPWSTMTSLVSLANELIFTSSNWNLKRNFSVGDD